MANSSDTYDLERYVTAQRTTYDRACSELRAGRKQSHWMWFVFPQMRGLGHSAMASRYGIASLDEARAYLAHPILGPRLVECVEVILAIDAGSAHEIFGSPDDLKLRSSMTLFARAGESGSIFAAALGRYFGGIEDPATLALLDRALNPSDS